MVQQMFRMFPDVHVDNDSYPVLFRSGDWITLITRDGSEDLRQGSRAGGYERLVDRAPARQAPAHADEPLTPSPQLCCGWQATGVDPQDLALIGY